MSTTVANITLVLVSLKKQLEEYLDANGWKKLYSVYLAHDPVLETKEIVSVQYPTRNQINLPLIVLDTGLIRGEIQQLGDGIGRDIVSLSIYVMAKDGIQFLTLSNLLRVKLEGWNINVKNYTSNIQTKLGTASLTQVDIVNTSSPNSDRVQERHSGIVNAVLEFDAESFL